MSASRQSGQALVLGLFTLFLGAISLFYLFSTGQVSADKQRVTNAADAAAYSAALWRARVLNFDAYANRAMIANEVAIAQSLTLASEVQYLKNLAACLALEQGDGNLTCSAAVSYVLQFFPYVTQAINAARPYIEEYDAMLVMALQMEIPQRSTIANRSLSLAQEGMHLSASFVALDEIADQIAAANDRSFRATVLPDDFEGGGNAFTRRYTGDDRNRLANVVRASLDGYTRDRRFTHVVVPGCIGGLQYRKRGGTALSRSLDRWEAADTHSEWESNLSWRGCRRREREMSWADRQAQGESDPNPSGVADNPRALRQARDEDVREIIENYIGIQPFRDLNYQVLRNRQGDAEVRNPRHKLHVVVTMAARNLRTANTLNVGTGRLRMTENTEDGRLASVAAAEVYFHRSAARADGRIELPSLFNPYWQARLADVEPAARTAALAVP